MHDYNMKMQFNKLKKKLFSLIAIFILMASALHAANFYWENPVSITNTNTQFPRSVSDGKDSYLFWQEVDEKAKKIYITARKYNNLKDFTEVSRFAGPISYSSEVPDLYSVTMLKNGTLAVAVLTNPYEITVYTSKNGGETFTPSKIRTSEIMVAPRIFATSRNTFILFTSVGEEDSFNISYAESSDGVNWGNFQLFEPASACRSPFVPYLIGLPQGGDLVVFQAQYSAPGTNRLSYQLYSSYFDVNSQSWSPALLLTDRNSLTNGENKEFTAYQNQSPSLYNFNRETYLVWERTENVNSQIKIAEITTQGLKTRSTETIANLGNASRGNLFTYDDKLCMVWFDTRRGRESVYMAERDGSFWEEISLVENRNSNLFAYPVFIRDSENPSITTLSFIWQQKTQNGKNTIGMLNPDKSVNPPSFTPLSFKKGRRASGKNVSIQINFPQDSSNIAGYSYTWSKDESVEPPKQIQHFTKENKVSAQATEDGKYYLTVRVQDFAGNWSAPESIMYYLDLTPPEPPVITFNNVDKHGFINSNTFNIYWEKSPDEDVAGYTYRIDYLGDIPKTLGVSKGHPLKMTDSKVQSLKESLFNRYENAAKRERKLEKKIRTSTLSSIKYYNRENGVYVFTIAAIDEVGNIGPSAKEIFILNKFQPSTYISSISKKSNDAGNIILTINGGGFTYDGTVSHIMIDSDGVEPYDLVLERDKGQYKVQNDSLITNVNIGSDLDEGTYKILLYHTDRGLYKSGNILKIDQSGTLKIEGEYVPENQYSQEFIKYKYKLVVNLVVAVLIVLIVGLLCLFIIGTSAKAGFEETVSKQEVTAVLKGGKMPMKKLHDRLHPLPSLRRTIIRFTYLLIVLVVLVVTIENASKLITMQKNTMASGLENRTEVLLESLASGVKNFFPSNNILELSALPGQKDAMTEVKYVTILGQPQESNSTENLNYVWATNDPDITDKIDNYLFEQGVSQITDPVILDITSKFSAFDTKIRDEVAELAEQINELNAQLAAIDAGNNPDKEALLESVASAQASCRNQLDAKLQQLAKEGSGSYPFFDSENLDESQFDYLFYRPVTYRQGNSGNYVHGIVYLEVSTKDMIESLHRELNKIIIFGMFVAVIAVIIGILGAALFASLLVKPIKKLEQHVLMIGRTKNKVMLKGKDIKLKTKNEVGRLGDAVNNMTHELVQVAIEEELTMDGKAVQKAFLPLMNLEGNNKATTAEYEDQQVQCYGYYEGESGVSGDYFDYRRLDNEWFVAIKCDVSGHGIPAAIIMTVVATMFRRYFDHWTYKHDGTRFNILVEQINDFIESLGLKGKFATMIICLLNTKTGEVHMCNAGDNLVHIYEQSTQKVKTITLASTPTAGVFTSDLVNMRGGFVVEKLQLNHGDVLFLYTDGIEESTRRIRDASFVVKMNDVEVKKMDPKTHQEVVEIKTEEAKEEFGPERISAIIEAIFTKQSYELTKEQNPMPGETLQFDFTKSDSSLKDVILGLASLEKVFRLYKPEGLTRTEYIRIDKKIDEFLQQYFNRYELYSRHKSEETGNASYVDYEHMLEDEQSDDLTLLAIKRI